jgi:hypothetical protein
MGDNIKTIKKNIVTLIDASKEVGLEVNTRKTKYLLMSHHENAVKYHDMKTANSVFENMVKTKLLGMAVKYQNLIHDEIKSRLNSDNACYHLVENFCLLFCSLKE